MTYDQMVWELADRGFAHISATRRGTYINAARAELDRMYLWPYREASASGAAPLTVSDLGGPGNIAVVQATTLQSVALDRADYGYLADTYGDLTLTGTPEWYYVSYSSGTPIVTVFPVSTASISVRYWKVPPDLTAGQSPISPSEFHYVIVDLAARQAYNDNDEFFSASMVQQEADRKIAQLVTQYPPGVPDGPDSFVGVSGASEDW